MVGIVPTVGCMIPANGQRIFPGQNATFELVLDEGYSFAGTDYTGKYIFAIENGKQMLHLYDVRYPTRVHLWLTDSYRTITYNPNGGEGKPMTVTYDVSVHTCPNASIETDIYSRPGYTLAGWNTAPDGTGTAVGLGSRVTVPPLEEMTLYAQWVPWTEAAAFSWEEVQGCAVITGYAGTEAALVIPERLDYLNGLYQNIRAKGAAVYVSYACVNIDAVPEEQKQNVEKMDSLFRGFLSEMEGVRLVSRLSDYVYHNEDFYDTNYHLLSDAAWNNTSLWMADLCGQLEQDGLYTP